jgi:transposase-like protein
MSLLSFQMKFKDEQACRDWLAEKRWGGHNKAICPHCNHNVCYIHNGIDRYTCQTCSKQFSVRSNTIFEDSRLPLVKWFIAIFLFSSLKKGISSIQLSKYIEITQKSAWFMLQRIREVMDDSGSNGKFTGTCEIDETHVGGKAQNMHMSKRIKANGVFEKSVVMGIVNRDTKQVKGIKVDDATSYSLINQINSNINTDSIVITDEHKSYHSMSNEYNHKTVNHSKGEYVKDSSTNKRGEERKAFKVHTNSIEGFWSQLKRGINGIYHWASKKHIQKYVNEFAYRYNNKEFSDFEMFANWFVGCEGRKLSYVELIK